MHLVSIFILKSVFKVKYCGISDLEKFGLRNANNDGGNSGVSNGQKSGAEEETNTYWQAAIFKVEKIFHRHF